MSGQNSAADVSEKPVSGGKTTTKRNGLRIVVLVAAVVVVLALALGLGLGLGLKHSKSKATSSSSSSPGSTDENGPSYASTEVQDWRRSTLDYNLDLPGWDFNAAPTTRSYNLTLTEIAAAPDGVNKTVLAINGQFPGPLIRLNRGDRLLVNVTNHMSNSTAMHWHGMFQNGTNWMDGTSGITQCPIQPGQSFLYNFTVDNQYGTYWYHAHVATQYIDGIVGPLVVHAPEEVQVQQQMYDFDQVIMIQDWYHDLSPGLLDQYLSSGNENVEPVPDNGLVQGENYFNCSSYDPDSGYVCSDNSSRPTFEIEQDKRYRLRFINTGAFTTFEVSVDNHSLAVIEADGTATVPLPVHRFEIATAQRYSVVLTANQTNSTNYWMRTTMITDCYAGDNDVLDPSVMALVTYKNTTDTPTASNDWAEAPVNTCQDLNSSLLVPLVAEQAPPATALYQLSFSFEIGADADDRASVNGTQWIPDLVNPTLNQAVVDLSGGNLSTTNAGLVTTPGAFTANQLVITLPESEPVIDLLVQNFDDGPHPFHLHGHSFWVMATSADEDYFPWGVTSYYANLNSSTTTDGNRNPMRRDTITIQAYSWVLLRFRNDVPGMWAFHCHNIWHMEAGLLAQLMALPATMKSWTLPKDWLDLCPSP